ncbi:S66 family peptidase [Tuberibacillus sp. Marseille-P3662]|uniref:S66 family peptidase n=1 Tax=Tuberibacillus sp. Marseille-P3662 TaxID=1965358 RepID=UPI000A1C8783|nr:S66 peptidase family protein [Tuberibacillus sp. Marseille-P3662]
MNRLTLGSKIGIFSSSSPITYTSPTRFERSKDFLTNKGFSIEEGHLTKKYDGYRSGSIQARADEVNHLLRDPDVHCLMATVGGTNTNAILPYIDYEAFRRNPKVIVGYSDTTALLFALYAQTGIPTFYGPALIPSFGEFPPFVNDTYQYFKDLFVSELSYPYHLPMLSVWTDEPINWDTPTKTKEKEQHTNKWISLKDGVSEGRLIAGNLNTMYGIWGSPYMPDIRNGDILMIEDSLKDAATVEKNFSLLKVNGVFDRIGGLILGKHELFDDQGTGKKPYDILLEVIGEPTFPILADFDSCHTHPMIPLPIGTHVKLDTYKKEVTLTEDPFNLNVSKQ